MCPHKGVVNALLNGKTPTIQVLTVDVVIASLLQLQGINHVETFREKKMTSRLLPTPRPSKMTNENQESWAERKQTGKVSTPPLALAINTPSYSQADFLANPSPAQESEKERQMTATSGLICYESSKSSIPDGLLRKMSEVLLTSKTWWNRAVTLGWKMTPITEEKTVSQQAHLFASSMTLNKQVIQSKYFLYQLAVSGRATNGTDCGLLLTPKANEVEENQKRFVERNADRSMNCYPTLSTQIAMLPTPATRDYRGANGPDHMSKDRPHMDQFPNAITHGTNRGLKLQPAFVEWMMGYPDKWTELID